MIIVPQAQGRRYMVMGLGISGLATVQSLRASQADVWAWDDEESLRAQAVTMGAQVCPLEEIGWASLAALVLSPGIPHTHPHPHVSAQKAREANVPIICDLDLLAQAQPQAQYVGVTGTNGKSTTTALIGHLLKTGGQSFQVGGNIGAAALALEPLEKGATYILELSSYQLERVPHLELDIAVLLNIAPDHLARHGGMEGYVAAKKSIFEHGRRKTGFAGIVGMDDPYGRAVYKELKSKYRLFCVSGQTREDICVESGILYDENHPVLDLSGHPVLLGLHNAQNVAAAYAAGKLLGIRQADLIDGIKSFKGLPHRLEIIGECEGVRFVNDSKATNANAVAKALACFDQIYWILGGQAKENGLAGLEAFYPRIRHAFLLGEATERFAATLKGRVDFTNCGTLEKAVREAFGRARRDPGRPVVLLSPACASWDQFRNFEHRGQVFREAFEGLKMT